MKSNLGNLKLLPSARGALVTTYKQQHSQQLQTARKVSESNKVYMFQISLIAEENMCV